MGCDGIFDKLTNREAIDLIWTDIDKSISAIEDDNKSQDATLDPHQTCSKGVDLVLSESVKKKTLDNITVVMISFNNFQKS
jgi:protein phosphatase 2C family protein 2/3